MTYLSLLLDSVEEDNEFASDLSVSFFTGIPTEMTYKPCHEKTGFLSNVCENKGADLR